jgi:hypothetical protein
MVPVEASRAEVFQLEAVVVLWQNAVSDVVVLHSCWPCNAFGDAHLSNSSR